MSFFFTFTVSIRQLMRYGFKAFLLIYGCIVLSATSIAQSNTPHSDHSSAVEEHHNHLHHHDHDNHRNELGIALSPVYFSGENEISFGMHLHYLYRLSNSKFLLGVSVEQIMDDHKHRTIGVAAGFNPWRRLTFVASSGVTHEKAEPGIWRYAQHIEATYEFEIGHFHIGPLIESAFDREDIHFSVGLHIGIGF